MEEIRKSDITINSLEQLHDFLTGKITFEELDGATEEPKYSSRSIVCDWCDQYTLDMLKNAMELYKNREPNMFFDFYLRIICRCLLENLNLGKNSKHNIPNISEYPKWDLYYYIADFEFDIPRTEKRLLLYVMSKMLEEYLQISFEVPLGKYEEAYYEFDYYGVNEEFTYEEFDDEDKSETYANELISRDELFRIIGKGYEIIDTFLNNYKKTYNEWTLTKTQAVNYINNNIDIASEFLINMKEDDRSLLVKCLDTITNTKKDSIESIYCDAYYLKAFLLWDSIPGYYQKNLANSKELLDKIYTCQYAMDSGDYILITYALGLLYFFADDKVFNDNRACCSNSLNYFYVGHYAEIEIEKESQMACYLPAFIGYKDYRYNWSKKAINEEENLYSKYKLDFINKDMHTPFADAALNMYFLKESENRSFTYILEAIRALKRRQEHENLYKYIIDQYLMNIAENILELYVDEIDEYSFDKFQDIELLDFTEQLRSNMQ